MTRRPDDKTLDLFDDYEPEDGVVAYTEEDEFTIRAASLDSKIAKAVALALSESGFERSHIAWQMTRYLGGERVTVHMLNKYASEAAVDHRIPLARFAALIDATQDYRLLSLLPELFGFSVVDDKYLPWIKIGQLSEHRDTVTKELDALKRSTKKRGRK